jgi:hypothetical protein
MAGLTEIQLKETDKVMALAGGLGNLPLATILGGIICDPVTATSTTAPALDFTKSGSWFCDISDNATVTVTNPTHPCIVKVKVQQAGAGSKTFTLPATFIGTYAITATADKYDHTFWHFDGTNYILIAATKGLDA